MIDRNFEQAMQAIQSGNLEEGARLLRILLKEEMPPNIRAVALMWLAETNPDMSFKIECYRQAISADPSNTTVSERLSVLLASQLPPSNPYTAGNTPSQGMPPVNPNAPYNPYTAGNTPSQGMPPVNPNAPYNPYTAGNTPSQGMPPVNPNAPYNPYTAGNTPSQGMPPVNPNAPYGSQGLSVNPNDPHFGASTMPIDIAEAQRTVGISGGVNGSATGFFIAHTGIIATTRHAIDAQTSVRVELMDKRTLEGTVIRSFTSLDLALIRVNANVRQLLRATTSPVLMDNTPLIAITHGGEGIRTAKRATRQETAPHWIPTMINSVPNDSGGNPMIESNGTLVGMLTRNHFGTNGYFYALHITAIYQALQLYEQEVAQFNGAEAVYCPQCGALSRAKSMGGHYCETCGSTLPYALQLIRQPNPATAVLYGEHLFAPCTYCGARVGKYDEKCLRCDNNKQP